MFIAYITAVTDITYRPLAVLIINVHICNARALGECMYDRYSSLRQCMIDRYEIDCLA